MRVAVVGAGIVGVLAGIEAARHGHRVDLYEESREPGRGASGHNAGVIHVLQPPFVNRKARLAVRANPLHDRLAREAGYEILRLPGILPYRGARGRILALAARVALSLLGYRVRLVGPDVFRDLCPASEARFDGALLVEGYATVVPAHAVDRLWRLAGSLGVDLRVGVRVERVKPHRGGGGPLVVSELGSLEYGSVIVAAGADTPRLAREAGLGHPRVGFYKGVMAFARLDCRAVAAELASERRSKKTKGGGIIPWPDGRVVLGPTFAETSNPWDTSVGPSEARAAASLYKGLLGYEPPVEGAIAGTRVKNMERDDFYTKAAGRVAVLGAIDSPGFTAAPLLASWAALVLGLKPR